MLQTVPIANGGEVPVGVIRAVVELGAASVAVYASRTGAPRTSASPTRRT